MSAAQENANIVRQWIELREFQRDYVEYERRGKINLAEVLRDIGDVFGRSVFYQNPEVSALISAAEERWYGTAERDEKSFKAASERSDRRSSKVTAENSKLLDELAKLKAENALLKRQLQKYAAIDEVIHSTGLVRL